MQTHHCHCPEYSIYTTHLLSILYILHTPADEKTKRVDGGLDWSEWLGGREGGREGEDGGRQGRREGTIEGVK